MATTTTKKAFVTGTPSTNQVTASGNFDTALANLANGTGGVTQADNGINGIQIIQAGLTVASDTTVAATYSYAYWAFVQYTVTA